MSKEFTPSEIAARLAELGIAVPEELASKIEHETEDNAFHAVTKAFSLLSSESKDVAKVTAHKEQIVTRLFDLAFELANSMPAEIKNQGRGTVESRTLRVETHNGSLKVNLSRVVQPTK